MLSIVLLTKCFALNFIKSAVTCNYAHWLNTLIKCSDLTAKYSCF